MAYRRGEAREVCVCAVDGPPGWRIAAGCRPPPGILAGTQQAAHPDGKSPPGGARGIATQIEGPHSEYVLMQNGGPHDHAIQNVSFGDPPAVGHRKCVLKLDGAAAGCAIQTEGLPSKSVSKQTERAHVCAIQDKGLRSGYTLCEG